MSTDSDPAKSPPAPLREAGSDLVLPLLGIAFAVYYLSTILDLPRSAQIGGMFSSGGVIVLSLAVIGRTLWRLRSGRARFTLMPLVRPWPVTVIRLILLALLCAFILLFETLGLTTSVFLFLLLALPLAGVRAPVTVLAVSFCAAAICYAVFIAFLPTQFPEGPLEAVLQGLFR